MKRGVIDTLRRGLDNTLANWPVSLLRLGEAILFGLLAILTVLAVIVPVIVSAGIHFSDVKSPEDLGSVMAALMEGWIVLVWILLAVLVLLGVFILIHSFVEAGCARIAVDADRAAGPAMEGDRARFRVFSMDRWLRGGVEGWLPVFWIYNLAWGLAGLFMLIPLLPTLALVLVFRESPGPLIASGCIGLVVSLLFMIFVAIVTGIWTNRAIAGWAARREGARDALATAWRALRLDLARHVLVALAILVVGMAGSSVFASFSFFAAMGDSLSQTAMINLVTLPIRIASSLLSSAFSAVLTTWYLSAYVAMAVEERSDR